LFFKFGFCREFSSKIVLSEKVFFPYLPLSLCSQGAVRTSMAPIQSHGKEVEYFANSSQCSFFSPPLSPPSGSSTMCFSTPSPFARIYVSLKSSPFARPECWRNFSNALVFLPPLTITIDTGCFFPPVCAPLGESREGRTSPTTPPPLPLFSGPSELRCAGVCFFVRPHRDYLDVIGSGFSMKRAWRP